jgi:hypothetical protein
MAERDSARESGMGSNPKSESRNPKQIQMTELIKSGMQALPPFLRS